MRSMLFTDHEGGSRRRDCRGRGVCYGGPGEWHMGRVAGRERCPAVQAGKDDVTGVVSGEGAGSVTGGMAVLV